jgi:hypothetical protein
MKNIDEKTVIEIVKCAKETFCDGIYVPCNTHPCGWDFISFENFEAVSTDAIDYPIDCDVISDGIYNYHPYEGLTLIDILGKTNGKYAFEIGSINW